MSLLKEISFAFITSLEEYEEFNRNNIIERSYYTEEINVPFYYTFEDNLHVPLRKKDHKYIANIFVLKNHYRELGYTKNKILINSFKKKHEIEDKIKEGFLPIYEGTAKEKIEFEPPLGIIIVIFHI